MKLLLAVILSSGLVISLVGCKDNKDKDNKGVATDNSDKAKDSGDKGPVDQQDKDKNKPSGRKPVPGTLSAESLVKDFLDNPEAAEKKHGDKEIFVEGVVEKTTEARPATTLTLKGAKDKKGQEIVVYCSFPIDDRPLVEKVKPGDTVVVKGKFADYAPEKNKLSMNFCRLVTE